MNKPNIMKKSLFLLALLVSFGSFGQLDSKGNEYDLPQPTLEFENNSEMSKENLMKELKCPPVALAGRKYRYIDEVAKQDVLLKVVSFDVSISGQEPVTVKGNSIGDSSIAKNLLDIAKVGDFVVFSDALVVSDSGFQFTIRTPYTFEIIEQYISLSNRSQTATSKTSGGKTITIKLPFISKNKNKRKNKKNN